MAQKLVIELFHDLDNVSIGHSDKDRDMDVIANVQRKVFICMWQSLPPSVPSFYYLLFLILYSCVILLIFNTYKVLTWKYNVCLTLF